MAEKTMMVRYVGEKAPRTFPLPMPFLATSGKTGEVTFAQRMDFAEIEAEQAKLMVQEFPMLFELMKAEKKKD